MDIEDIIVLIAITSDTSGLNWKGVVIWILFIVVLAIILIAI